MGPAERIASNEAGTEQDMSKFERYMGAARLALVASQMVSETVVREQGHTVSEAARAVRESHAVTIAALSQVGLVDEDGEQVRKPYSQAEIGDLYGMSKATAERIIRLGIILTTHPDMAEGTLKKIRKAINSSDKETRLTTDDALRIAEATVSPATTLAEILAEKAEAASNEATDGEADGETDGEGAEETVLSPTEIIDRALMALTGTVKAVQDAATLSGWTDAQRQALATAIESLKAAGRDTLPMEQAA